ncbi:MAG: hypothetical protein H0V17_35645 [Deltaproteobacteria bacterium]|nr:hypothetical protein [Deltaproteobacteria bacterium]
MRWLICFAIVFAASAVDARLVISEPPMVRKCPKAKTWGLVMSCLAKHSTPKVTRELKGAKLVTLFQKAGSNATVDTGVLLYIERDGHWQIGGRFENYGGEYTVLGLSALTVGKRTGYRLDLGQASPFTLMVDNISPIPALLRVRRSLLCSGETYACREVTTACEVTVNGLAWYVFRGTLTIQEDSIAVVDGDRDRAGAHCAASQKVYLGWAK